MNNRSEFDSRMVAKILHHDHEDLLRKIRRMECSEDFRRKNFLTWIEFGRKNPCLYVVMTRAGLKRLMDSFEWGDARKILMQKFMERESTK